MSPTVLGRDVGTVLLSVFIPGKLVNPQASSRGGTWHKRARLARDIRERTAQHILARRNRIPCQAGTPKLVVFTAWVWNLFDDDNLRTAIKPYRDALRDMRVIDDDRPGAGHRFDYAQFVTRGGEYAHKFGLDIVVALLPTGRAAGDGGEG